MEPDTLVHKLQVVVIRCVLLIDSVCVADVYFRFIYIFIFIHLNTVYTFLAFVMSNIISWQSHCTLWGCAISYSVIYIYLWVSNGCQEAQICQDNGCERRKDLASNEKKGKTQDVRLTVVCLYIFFAILKGQFFV